MERHGWVIKSFGDAAGEVQGVALPSLFSFGDFVPEPFQKLLEGQVDGRGSNIDELSLFGAMMEYHIKDETIRGLQNIYDLKRFPTSHPIGKWQAEFDRCLHGLLHQWLGCLQLELEGCS